MRGAGFGPGPPRAPTTGPGWPRGAVWMCAARAGPLRPSNVICQEIVPPASVRVTVAVNTPRAPETLPDGAGVSSAAVIVVLIVIDVA